MSRRKWMILFAVSLLDDVVLLAIAVWSLFR